MSVIVRRLDRMWHRLNNVCQSGARTEDLGGACFVKLLDVLTGEHPADEDGDRGRSDFVERGPSFGDKVLVAATQDAQSHNVGIFVNGHCCDTLRRVAKT